MMSTVLACAGSAKLAQLPPSVADYLRRLVTRMNRSNERVHAHLVGIGRYSAEQAAECESLAMANARIELADFRAIASKQGFNAESLIEAAAVEFGWGEFASLRSVVFSSWGN